MSETSGRAYARVSHVPVEFKREGDEVVFDLDVKGDGENVRQVRLAWPEFRSLYETEADREAERTRVEEARAAAAVKAREHLARMATGEKLWSRTVGELGKYRPSGKRASMEQRVAEAYRRFESMDEDERTSYLEGCGVVCGCGAAKRGVEKPPPLDEFLRLTFEPSKPENRPKEEVVATKALWKRRMKKWTSAAKKPVADCPECAGQGDRMLTPDEVRAVKAFHGSRMAADMKKEFSDRDVCARYVIEGTDMMATYGRWREDKKLPSKVTALSMQGAVWARKAKKEARAEKRRAKVAERTPEWDAFREVMMVKYRALTVVYDEVRAKALEGVDEHPTTKAGKKRLKKAKKSMRANTAVRDRWVLKQMLVRLRRWGEISKCGKELERILGTEAFEPHRSLFEKKEKEVAAE